MSLLHLLLLSLLLLLLPLLLPFHFSIARIADASHKRRLSTAIASAASASSRELDFLTRATADLESLALGERKPGVGTAAPRMIAECPRAVLPSMSLKHHPRVRTGGPLRSRSSTCPRKTQILNRTQAKMVIYGNGCSSILKLPSPLPSLLLLLLLRSPLLMLLLLQLQLLLL